MVMGNITNKTKWTLIGCMILLMTACVGLLPFFFDEKIPEVSDEQVMDYKEIMYQDKQYRYNSSIISFLFIGTDQDNRNTSKNGQADSLFLVLLNRESEEIHCIPISRDTMSEVRVFDIEGNDLGWHTQQLSLAYAYGKTPSNGCMYTIQAVSKMLHNIPINYYISIDVSDVTNIQEMIGDIEVKVPNDTLVDVNSHWRKGNIVTINKDNVELFIRSRDVDKEYSNEERMERQIAYLEAIRNKFCSLLADNQEQFIQRLYENTKSIVTNISLQDLQVYSNMFSKYSYHADDMHSLQGVYQSTIHDEFILDEEALMKLLVDVFYKEGY